MLWLLGCDVQLSGTVTNPAGQPVAGAELVSGDCRAVTDATGAFLTRCARGTYRFDVTHPTHAPGVLSTDAGGALSPPPGAVTLVPWPTEPGLYLEPGLEPLARVALVRTAAPDEQKFCVATTGGEAPPADAAAEPLSLSLFEVRAVDWRLFALDDEGCALRLRRPPGTTWWQPSGERLAEASRTSLAPGRDRVTLSLPPGRYVAAAWYDGFLVPDDVAADSYLAWGVEGQAPQR